MANGTIVVDDKYLDMAKPPLKYTSDCPAETISFHFPPLAVGETRHQFCFRTPSSANKSLRN